jgi:UbiD family decarboxylase
MRTAAKSRQSLVKCETIDLMVPANAEIVLECELMATEGWVHDEAPFGEFTGMYGGGLKHNVRAVVKAITHRENSTLIITGVASTAMRPEPTKEAVCSGPTRSCAVPVRPEVMG